MEEFAIIKIAAGVMICTEVIKGMFFQDEILRNRFVPAIAIAFGVLFNAWDNGFIMNYDIFLGGLASGFAGIGAYSTAKSVITASQLSKELKEAEAKKVAEEQTER